jgi:hypothetical protein
LLVYWLLFLYFVAGAIREQPRQHLQAHRPARADVLFRIGCLAIALIIGLRYRIGADWIPYEEMLSDAAGQTLGSLPVIADPGYSLINIAVQRIGGELWLAILCAARSSPGV